MAHFERTRPVKFFNRELGRSFVHFGPAPAVSVDAAAQIYDQPQHIFNVWEDACLTVERLSSAVQKNWPGAIEYMQHYGEGIRIKFRSKSDELLFEGVILGAWERAFGFAGTEKVRRKSKGIRRGRT